MADPEVDQGRGGMHTRERMCKGGAEHAVKERSGDRGGCPPKTPIALASCLSYNYVLTELYY